MKDIQKILSPIDDAIWSFDLVHNKFIYFNERLSELFEAPVNFIHEDPSFWLAYVHPEDYQYASTETEQLYIKKSIEIEYRILVKGKQKWVLDKKAVVFDENNIPQLITGILSDITKKKDSEAQLTDLEKTFRYLFINNPNPLWIYDRKTLKFLEVNNSAIAKYGYSKDEFLALTIADIRPKEDLEELLKHVKNVNNTYLNSQKYWRHLKKNGDILYVNVSGHGITYKGNEAEMIMSHDITLEVESRQSITLAKENLDALINSIKEDIWSIDTEYRLISANSAFKQMINKSIGRDIKIGESIFLTEYDSTEKMQWKKYYDKALGGETFSFIEMVKLPSQDPFCAEIKMNPIKNKKKIIGVACISTDIQDRLKAQERIIEQNNKLHELVSLASHEIRGPVATLLGLTGIFNKNHLADPFNGEVITMINDVTIKLDSVIHKLVDKSHSLRQENTINNSQYNQSVNE